MNSIISKNRRWRIKLYDDKCNNVQFGCDEHHFFIPLELMYKNFQRTIFFALRFQIDLFLQRWKALDEFHNLAYFNIYYIMRCIEVVVAKKLKSFDVHF